MCPFPTLGGHHLTGWPSFSLSQNKNLKQWQQWTFSLKEGTLLGDRGDRSPSLLVHVRTHGTDPDPHLDPSFGGLRRQRGISS